MIRRKNLITFLTFALIIFTTFTYSALSTRFQVITDVVFRVDADIRITDILLDSTSNGGLISFDSNYTKNTITSGFKLPNLNSTVSYNVTITNKGNIDQAIYNITTISSSNNNIYYLIDDKPINEALPMIVPLGTSKTIKITYKTTSPFTQTETIVNSFVFKKVYYVDYNLKGGSYTNDQNDLKNGQIKYEDVDLTLTNEKPIKNKYVFIGWTDEQNGETVKYPSGSTYSLNKNIILYAVYRQGEATFLPGSEFNSKIKILAGNANATYNTQDTNITSIVRANSLPNGFTPTNANIVSTEDSDFPIYAWYDNGTIYYYTVIDNPYMNSIASSMFDKLSNVETIDLSSINTSRTTDMSAMFRDLKEIQSLDLSSFNTSNVTDMTSMFATNSTSKLKNIDLSSFNTSNVISMRFMFYNMMALENLDLSGFNTSKVTDMSEMFRCLGITTLDLSSFDMSNVTSLSNMLVGTYLITSLKTPKIYPSNLSIGLSTTLYDSTGNSYPSLNSSSPTETWLKLAYTVSFNSNGGTGTMNDQKIQYNTDTNLHTNTFTRTNYTFAGWNTKADGTGTAYLDGASVNALTSANGTITLYAQWVGFTYTVTADANGGSIPSTSGWTGTGSTSTKTVNFGSTYGTLPTPTRTGYTFNGWNGKNMFNEEELLMAISGATYENDHYVFSSGQSNILYGNDGFPISLDSNKRYTISLSGYIESGSFYLGFRHSDSSLKKIMLTSSEEIIKSINSDLAADKVYASYGVKGITHITYIQLEEGTTATSYEPYYISSSTNVTQTKNHTLTAIWEPNNYEIVFDKNDTNATGTMGNQSMTYDVSSNLTANAFTKPGGYKFVGWNTKTDGTGTAYLNGASVSNLTNVNNGTITLYAQWEKIMAEDVGHTIQGLNCENVQCVIDELYYMLY